MLGAKERALLLALSETEYRTSGTLAKALGVSSKTAQGMVKDLREKLQENGADILARTRHGYLLQVNDRALFETLSSDTGVLDAVRALRETVPDAFVQVSFAVLPDGYTREGQHCRALVRRMADSGLVDAVGLNCVSAPGAMRTLVQQLGQVGIPLTFALGLSARIWAET